MSGVNERRDSVGGPPGGVGRACALADDFLPMLVLVYRGGGELGIRDWESGIRTPRRWLSRQFRNWLGAFSQCRKGRKCCRWPVCSINCDGHGFARAVHGVVIEIRLVFAPPGQRAGAVPGLNRACVDAAPELGGALRAAARVLVETGEYDRFEVGRDGEPSRRQRL